MTRPRPRRLITALAAGLLATGAALVAASPAHAANLVSNPGFESGLTGWTCSAGTGSTVSSPVHSGAAALAGAASSSNNAQCTQNVTVLPGTAYTLSAWVRGTYVFLGVTGGVSTWTPSAPTYSQLTTSFTTTASQTSVQVYLHGWYGQGTYNADDVSLDGPGGPPGQVPGVPGNPSVTGVTDTGISLSWGASTGTVTNYRVYEGTAIRATVTGTSATVSGLAACSSHTYNITAVNSTGESVHSGNVTGTTTGCGNGVPGTPGTPAVTGATNTSISLSWTASAGTVTNYRVYEGATIRATVTGTSATVGGLAACTTHTYNVTAVNANGESPHSGNVTGSTTGCTNPGGMKKVGYYPQWGIYGRNFWLNNVDDSGEAAKLTHLNYAFENISSSTQQCFATTSPTSPNPQDPNQGDNAGDSTADYAWPVTAANSVDGRDDGGWGGLGPVKGNFNQLKKLKAKYPNLKVLVSLGGWTYSKYFSDAASTPAKRQALARSCIDMYIKGNLPVHQGMGGPGTGANIFDGIDLDWEWPGAEGHPGNHFGAQDKANNTLLIAEFRNQLNALTAQTGKPYLLTAFLPADPAKVAAGWDIGPGGVFNYLDFGNVQGYDFHGAGSDNSWEPNRTGHQSNLFACTDDPYPFHFSIDSAISVYLNAGVDAKKLTVGFPLYGRGWQQVQSGPTGANGSWQTANGAAPGQFAEEAGTRGYANLLSAVPGMTVFHNTQCIATYGYTGNGGQWWTFDDAWSIGQKTAWIKSKGLGGAMVWELSGDTSSAALMTAISNGLQ